MVCPECDTQIADDSKVCPKCNFQISGFANFERWMNALVKKKQKETPQKKEGSFFDSLFGGRE